MTINNIVSGFHSAGIYPFAPNIIQDKFPKPNDSSVSTGKTSEKADVIEDSASMKKVDHDVISLTPEAIKLYERRLENGYNVYTDLNYVAWLEKFHPDHLPPLGMLMFVVTCLSHITV